jgi:hypothetical protein
MGPPRARRPSRPRSSRPTVTDTGGAQSSVDQSARRAPRARRARSAPGLAQQVRPALESLRRTALRGRGRLEPGREIERRSYLNLAIQAPLTPTANNTSGTLQHDEAASAPITPPAARSFWVRGRLSDAVSGRATRVWFSAWLVMLPRLHPVVTTASRGNFRCAALPLDRPLLCRSANFPGSPA